MIVNKPIGAIKINGIISRLSVGKPVPENILDYWKKNNQLEDLKAAEIIIEDGSAGKSTKKDKGKKDINDDSFFETKDG